MLIGGVTAVLIRQGLLSYQTNTDHVKLVGVRHLTFSFTYESITSRGVQFSVRDRIGPRTGSDRTQSDLTGPLRCGLRSKLLPNSVFGPVPGWTDRTGGPDRWIEFGQYFSFFFCPDWRWHGRACWHGLPVSSNLRGHSRAFWHGQTVPNSQDKTDPDRSDPRSKPSPDFDLQSRPVWSDLGPIHRRNHIH